MDRDIRTIGLSDVNLFLEEPAAFFLKRFLRHRGESGPKAHLGTAVEFGLASYLLAGGEEILPFMQSNESATLVPPWEDGAYARAQAERRFRELTLGEITEEIEGLHGQIGPMLQQAIPHLKSKQLLTFQSRTETVLCGVRVVGYTDFTFPGEVVDLKTTQRVPSEPHDNHLRQVAFYSHVKGLSPRLLYVSEKKSAWYEVTQEQQEEAMYQTRLALNAMSRIVNSQRPWEEIAELYPPRKMSSYRYDDEARRLIRTVWR